MTTGAATFDLEQTSRGLRFVARGQWIVANLKSLDGPLRKLAGQNRREREFIVDLGGVTRLDTAGAFVLYRTIKEFGEQGVRSSIVEISDDFQILFDEVAANDRPYELPSPSVDPLVFALDRIGAAIVDAFAQARSIMGLLGVTLVTFGRALKNPKRFRITSLVFHMEQAGLDAVPIVSLLTFLIGAVMAFLGAKILKLFGAEIFTVELVAFAVLRELSVILTAIIVAGRSGSAFTAQIGTMVVNEEIDAMRTIGIDPIEVLVLPRVLAFILMLPLLTFVADIMGLFGGIVVSWALLDISPVMFLVRMNETIPINNFWAGMIKAPFFAFVIALIGCHEGLNVVGTAESVGQRTTQSVVQSIFMVIVIDALFAMFYLEVDF